MTTPTEFFATFVGTQHAQVILQLPNCFITPRTSANEQLLRTWQPL